MTCVLIAQSLIFQDGGLLALGANILNMGIISSFSGYYLYRLLIFVFGNSRKTMLAGSFAGAWVAVVLSASAAALELAFSGVSPLGVVLPAMAGVHALVGIGEGLITGAVLSAVLATRSDLLQLKPI